MFQVRTPNGFEVAMSFPEEANFCNLDLYVKLLTRLSTSLQEYEPSKSSPQKALLNVLTKRN